MADKIFHTVDGVLQEATGETLAQIIADREAFESTSFERAYAQVEQSRAQAYREVADPLFFQYQRGEVTEQEWLDAVEAVKVAHPYPEAP